VEIVVERGAATQQMGRGMPRTDSNRQNVSGTDAADPAQPRQRQKTPQQAPAQTPQQGQD
jgi:hypothetical protein